MKKYTLGRERIIDYIGLHHAMPALKKGTGEPHVLKVGAPETELERVGWAAFFKAAEDRHYAFVYDDAKEVFEWEFLKLEDARAKYGSSLAEHAKKVAEGAKDASA